MVSDQGDERSIDHVLALLAEQGMFSPEMQDTLVAIQGAKLKQRLQNLSSAALPHVGRPQAPSKFGRPPSARPLPMPPHPRPGSAATPPGPGPSAAPLCDAGWTQIAALQNGGYDFGSANGIKNVKQIIDLPMSGIYGVSGVSSKSLADPVLGLVSIGAGLGAYCDLDWPAAGVSGDMDCTFASATLTKAFIVPTLVQGAPNALKASVSAFEPQSYPYQLIAGSPDGPASGLIASWGSASVEVFLAAPVPKGTPWTFRPQRTPHNHARASDWLWFVIATGGPAWPGSGTNALGGQWGTYPDPIIDQTGISPITVTASIGGPVKDATVILVEVSVDIACLRYKGSNGFAFVDCAAGDATPPILAVTGEDYQSYTQPISIENLCICGI